MGTILAVLIGKTSFSALDFTQFRFPRLIFPKRFWVVSPELCFGSSNRESEIRPSALPEVASVNSLCRRQLLGSTWAGD